MTMVSSGPISLGGTATTGGLNQSVNVELGRSGTASINMNESAVRTLAGVPSGAITMNNFYGKANQFSFTVTANTTNFNLRSAAVASGWNQNSRLVCTISSGVTVFSTSTGTAACTINGSFPGGVELINNGTILGAGGAGGNGRGFNFQGGTPGGGGGLGLLVQSAVSINNVNRISGGGGGGGGAGASGCAGSCFQPTPKGGSSVCDTGLGSGGGGGIGNGSGGFGGSSGCSGSGANGSPGSLTSGGTRGIGGAANGGDGGTYGSSGSPGSASSTQPTPPGAGGAAVSGNSNITWIAFGIRNGAIS